jgi:hypothetical protein
MGHTSRTFAPFALPVFDLRRRGLGAATGTTASKSLKEHRTSLSYEGLIISYFGSIAGSTPIFLPISTSSRTKAGFCSGVNPFFAESASSFLSDASGLSPGFLDEPPLTAGGNKRGITAEHQPSEFLEFGELICIVRILAPIVHCPI